MADRQAELNEAAFDELLRLEIEGVIGGPTSPSYRRKQTMIAEAAEALMPPQDETVEPASPGE